MFLTRLLVCAGALFSCLEIAAMTPQIALAQEARSTFGGVSSSAAASLGFSEGPSPDQCVAVGSVIVCPSFFAGALFNDNVYQRSFNRVAGVGLLVRPSLQALLDNGIHKTSAYFNADVQLYPGLGESYRFVPYPVVDAPPTNVTGRAGVVHTWSPMADLSVRLMADYTRRNGLFGSNFGVGLPQISLLSANTISSRMQYTNQYSGYVSVEKQFAGRWFLRGVTGAQYISYDSRPSEAWWLAPYGSATYGGNRGQDGLNYTGSLRAGAWVTPQLYLFLEPGADLRFYRNSWADTNGYHIVSGLGSDLISLFRGEIYGGYQSQTSAHGYFGTTSSPAFGARIFYYPTPYLTFSARVDKALSSAPALSAVTPFGAPLFTAVTPFGAPLLTAPPSSKTLQALVQADYAMSQYWSANLYGGYGETHYSNGSNYTNPSNVQTIWTAGARLNYDFWRNVSLTLEYQFTQTFSTNGWGSFASPLGGLGLAGPAAAFLVGAPSGFAQNLVSAGLTYRY